MFYERTIIMKKLAYLASAIFAGLGFTSTASADVSVSGSSTLAYTAAGSTTKIHTLGTVDFGLSTTTASGMTISSGASISMSTSGSGIVTGWDGLKFSTGGATIEIGTDVALADGVGEVDGVHAFDGTMDHSGVDGVTRTVSISSDEGTGFSLSTSLGGASIGLAYVANTGTDGGSSGQIDNATATGSSIKISTSIGAVGVTAAYVAQDTGSVNNTETAVSASYASDMGTITIGYGASDGSFDGTVMSGSYKMNLDADTTIALGYASYDVRSTAAAATTYTSVLNNATSAGSASATATTTAATSLAAGSSSGTETNVSVVRALGGGASVFADFGTVSGTTGSLGTSGETSAIAIGTSVSF